jgi:hypothetical protein
MTEDSISSVSFQDQQTEHTQLFYPGSTQGWCILCSRVNLVARKVTMKCKQCKFCFCRPSSWRECWLHHVAMGGLHQPPEKGMNWWRAWESYNVEVVNIWGLELKPGSHTLWNTIRISVW